MICLSYFARCSFVSFVVTTALSAAPQVQPDLQPPSVQSGWLAAAERGLREAAYEVRDGQALNEGQGFRIAFANEGVHVSQWAPREDSGFAFDWRLSMRGIGRASGADVEVALRAVRSDEAAVASHGNRFEYRHDGFTEWFVNDERGLEHGFTVDARVPGDSGSLVLAMDVTGSLAARNRDGGIDFLSPGDALVLRYDHLYAYDAAGRDLETWMSADDGGIRIVVDDRDAEYPIVIDPLTTNPAWATEGNANDKLWSYALQTAGDVNGDGFSDVIVGWDGGASVFHGSAAGLSTNAAWTVNSAQFNDFFGLSVATAGDVNGDGYSDVLVGAYLFDNGQSDEGRAYLYLGSPSGLATSAAFTAEGNQNSANFGYSVACAGDVNNDGRSDVIVGARTFGSAAGRAFVYHGLASAPYLVLAKTLENGVANAQYGTSVSTAGDMNADGYSDVIVGEPFASEGRTYLYLGSSAGVNAGIAGWFGGTQAGELLGLSVSTAGDVDGDGFADVIAGAPGFGGNSGRARVKRGGVSGFGPLDPLDLNHFTTGSFGASVFSAGDVNGDGYGDLIVGSPEYTSGQSSEGAATVWISSPTIGPTAKWYVESNQTDARFGRAVSTAGDVNGDGYSDFLVGAPYFDSGNTNEGKANLYSGAADYPKSFIGNDITAEGNQAEARFGEAVAPAGDVNGDGYSDVIIGAPLFDNGQVDEGRAEVRLGNAAGQLGQTPSWTAESDQAGANFGASVSTAGDVNGDGYADVIVGAPFFDNGENDEGRAFLYQGSSTGLGTSPAWTAESNLPNSWFGSKVAGAGDVNGDGYPDVLVGCPYYSMLVVREGAGLLYFGSKSGLASNPATIVASQQADSDFGFSVASAGDMNGDGFGDVVIGARAYSNGEVEEGRVFFYLGTSAGLVNSPSATNESNQANARLGFSVATAGDVNGDGLSDVIVGIPFYDTAGSDNGQVRVYQGETTVSGTFIASEFFNGLFANEHLGLSVSSAGDVNGDGFSDIIAGARGAAGGGVARIWVGSPVGTGIDGNLHQWSGTSGQSGAEYGVSVARAGDMNGDGFSDVLVGARYYDNGQANEGAVFAYLGNNVSPGRVFKPRQLKIAGSGPLAESGLAPAEGFRMELNAASPFGRGKIRLETEVTGIASTSHISKSAFGPIVDATNGSALLTRDEVGLPSGPYRWRERVRYVMTSTPYQPAGRWYSPPHNGPKEHDVTVAPAPSNLALDSTALVDQVFTLAGAAPGTVTRKLTNAGGQPLSMSVTSTPAVPWLKITPQALGGLLPSDPPKDIQFSFLPVVLPSGTYQTTAHFVNFDDPTDFEDVPVRFTVQNTPFVPGDRLVGTIDAPGDVVAGSFDAIKGMTIRLAFLPTAQKIKVNVVVRDFAGNTVAAFPVAMKPGVKVNKQVKLKTSGKFDLVLTGVKGAGPFQIKTNRKLPASASAISKLVSPDAALLGYLPIMALPGAVVNGTIKPKLFNGPMGLTFIDPTNAAFDVSAQLSATFNGGFNLNQVPLGGIGKHVIVIQGYGNTSEFVNAKLTILQPPKGQGIVNLP